MRIHIVDDDPDAAEIMAVYARDCGYSPLVFHDSEQCLAEFQLRQAELLFIDWKLPQRNGIWLTQRIRELELVRSHIILLSGVFTEPEHYLEGIRAGADYFMLKPIRREEIVGRIEVCARRLGGGGAPASGREYESICCFCKRVAVDGGSWEQIEQHLAQRHGIFFSHSVCPDCLPRWAGQFENDVAPL